MGWWKDSATDAEKEYIKRYLHTNGKDIAGDFMRESFKSVSKTSIVMLQVMLDCLCMVYLNYIKLQTPHKQVQHERLRQYCCLVLQALLLICDVYKQAVKLAQGLTRS